MTRSEAKMWLKSNRASTYKNHQDAFWAGYFDGHLDYQEEVPYYADQDSPDIYFGMDSDAWLDGYDCGHKDSPYHIK